MKLRRVETFEPAGLDVYFTSIMLFAQFFDMSVRIMNVYKELVNNGW